MVAPTLCFRLRGSLLLFMTLCLTRCFSLPRYFSRRIRARAQPQDGNTALTAAALSNCTACAQQLLAAGADTEVVTWTVRLASETEKMRFWRKVNRRSSSFFCNILINQHEDFSQRFFSQSMLFVFYDRFDHHPFTGCTCKSFLS
jgi:hypothetical protein